ncbi:MAG: NADH-quinone oxidoreductase subunit M, partial [Anaerolineae bacterium]
MSFPLLTIITFAPLLGALVILFLPKENERTIKNWSVLISLLPLALSIFLWFAYNKTSGGYQFQEVYSWIPQLGATYHMGVDG